MKRELFTKTKTDDQDLQGVQDNVAAAFRLLAQFCPIIDGQLIDVVFKSVAPGAYVATVPHGLGRKYSGYIVVRSPALCLAPAEVASPAPDRTIQLVLASTSVAASLTLTLWVF